MTAALLLILTVTLLSALLLGGALVRAVRRDPVRRVPRSAWQDPVGAHDTWARLG